MTGSHDPALPLPGEQLIYHSHDAASSLREQPPVRARFADGDEGWLITRYGDVKAVATDPRISRDLDGLFRLRKARTESSEAPGDDADDDPYGGYGWMYRDVLYLDPPDHTRLRKLVNKAFTPRSTTGWPSIWSSRSSVTCSTRWTASRWST